MSTFKVQKIRSCQQCGVLLGLKCKTCIAHPERKPKIIEVYDWPKILATCPSGDCIQISCQRDGCGGAMWRSRTHTRAGKMRSESMFCSRRCNILVLAKERDTRIKVPCGWCKNPVLRKQSQVKTFRAAYCQQSHYFLAMRKKEHDMKEGNDGRALLACSGRICRNAVTEHREVEEGLSECLICKTQRNSKISVQQAVMA